MIADKYQDTLNRTRKAVLHTLDPKDPEYITLLEELQRLLAKKNIEELTADEMTADIEALERIRKLAEQKNLADQMLAAKYDGDVKLCVPINACVKRRLPLLGMSHCISPYAPEAPWIPGAFQLVT